MQAFLPKRPAVSNRFTPYKIAGAALVLTWFAAMLLAYVVVGCPGDHEVQVRFNAPVNTADLAQLEACLRSLPAVDRWHYDSASATVTVVPKTGRQLFHSDVKLALAKHGLFPEEIALVHPAPSANRRMLN